MEGRCVDADLALGDDAPLVLEQVFDGVLDGDDVSGAVVVHVVDHGGQGRGLPRARRPRDEDQPPRLHRQLRDDGWQVEIIDGRRLVRHHPQGDRRAAPSAADARPIPPDPRDRVLDVDAPVALEALALEGVHHAGPDLLDLLALQRSPGVQPAQLTADP